MIRPAWVSKGNGLHKALEDLGQSRGNTIGVGDAENHES
jgi:hydroxymethylpyrimidine pyrophosphatase-like HAD family hydrolase